jgi:hypothetical protein
MLTPRRLALFGLGLLIVALAAGLLLYAAGPAAREREQIRPAPTLFVPPP